MKTVKQLMDLSGRVALITGGAGHIGSTIAEAFAELGANIAILDQLESQCRETCERLSKQYGVQTLSLPFDLTDEAAVRSVPERVVQKFGSLDILVHCAALVGVSKLEGWAVSFPQQSADTWRKALEINLTSVFVLTQAAVPALKASGHGSVVMIGSLYAVVGPDMGLYEGTTLGNPAAYAASKGGIVQLTRYLATVLAPEIRVNCISPGGVLRGHTDPFLSRYLKRTPLGRMATEEDLKGAAVYFGSDLSAYVTGVNLMVDGGWTAW